MVKCPTCGAEIKFIPVTTDRERLAVMVEPEETEIIKDNGRVVKGHLRHKCPEKESKE